jgi:hypothetical protein
MSTRMGMADSRCTNYLSTRIYNDTLLMETAHLNPYDDSTKYRTFLQNLDPESFFPQPKCSVFDYKEDFQVPK